VLGTFVGLLLALDFNKLFFFTLFFFTLDGNDLVRNGGVFGTETFHIGSVFTLINTLHKGILYILHVLGHLGACASL
jgi:hypothetical protein